MEINAAIIPVVKLIQGREYPLLRFTAVLGNAPDMTSQIRFDGCLGNFRGETGEFIWSPPAHKIFGRAVLMIGLTPDYLELITQALHRQGIVKWYTDQVKPYREAKPVAPPVPAFPEFKLMEFADAEKES